MQIGRLKSIIICIAIFVALTVWAIFVGCPIYRIFGVSCPACGMTRAFLSALRFDFATAFSYHPLFGLFMTETAYVLWRNIFPKLKLPNKAELIIGSVSLVLLVAVWVLRQFIL